MWIRLMCGNIREVLENICKIRKRHRGEGAEMEAALTQAGGLSGWHVEHGVGN
ncbi:hypothetical protein CK203_087314 [Vitis vinifera]|uniref:Uncharacterized protein n=1 Tax=Vitis vinifera TaxID=29760 RepID=A0A438BME6_VITVI|nr:hypothetical protein CK203_087314 [Vitis vinifera]